MFSNVNLYQITDSCDIEIIIYFLRNRLLQSFDNLILRILFGQTYTEFYLNDLQLSKVINSLSFTISLKSGNSFIYIR